MNYEYYKAAYLTMHGWVCNSHNDTWSKPGKTHLVSKTKFWFDDEKIETDEWEMDDAFWEAQEDEE